METIITALVAFLASLLTFFSGFGLGTILTPVLILFFNVETAIALTGIVHLLNNFFKIGLVGKYIDWKTGVKFGITAMVGALAGAEILFLISNNLPVFSYSFWDRNYSVTLVKLTIAVLMIVFALFEAIPALKKIQLNEKKIYAGGLLSGFFGGLSGNQGALRSMFLLRCGLNKEGFIATGIFIACAVDITRLSVYFGKLSAIDLRENTGLIITTILAAFTGAYVGSKLLKKVTLDFVQWAVTVLIILLAVGLGTGIL